MRTVCLFHHFFLGICLYLVRLLPRSAFWGGRRWHRAWRGSRRPSTPWPCCCWTRHCLSSAPGPATVSTLLLLLLLLHQTLSLLCCSCCCSCTRHCLCSASDVCSLRSNSQFLVSAQSLPVIGFSDFLSYCWGQLRFSCWLLAGPWSILFHCFYLAENPARFSAARIGVSSQSVCTKQQK